MQSHALEHFKSSVTALVRSKNLFMHQNPLNKHNVLYMYMRRTPKYSRIYDMPLGGTLSSPTAHENASAGTTVPTQQRRYTVHCAPSIARRLFAHSERAGYIHGDNGVDAQGHTILFGRSPFGDTLSIAQLRNARIPRKWAKQW